MKELEARSKQLLSHALAPTTRDNYHGAFKKYIEFCEWHHLHPLPVLENNLISFATHLSYSLAHDSIKVHLSAIAFYAAINDHSINFKIFKRLYYLMRGIKRLQSPKRKKRKRAPITPALLHIIKTNLFNSGKVYEDKVMLWAALLTAFYGFLRVSEYTSLRKKSFDPATTLLFSDCSFTRDGAVTIYIKASKTDPFRTGVPLRIEPNGSSLCPVNALRHHSRSHPSQTGPLFTFQNGRYLSRKDINSLLLATTDGMANISSHSLRIGAASTAAAAGCPKWLIQALGRWSSDCFREYIRIPKATIKQTSKRLAKCTRANIDSFDPDTLRQL